MWIKAKLNRKNGKGSFLVQQIYKGSIQSWEISWRCNCKFNANNISGSTHRWVKGFLLQSGGPFVSNHCVDTIPLSKPNMRDGAIFFYHKILRGSLWSYGRWWKDHIVWYMLFWFHCCFPPEWPLVEATHMESRLPRKNTLEGRIWHVDIRILPDGKNIKYAIQPTIHSKVTMVLLKQEI